MWRAPKAYKSGPRLTLNTQGSAKPPPWAKFLYRLRGYFFAVFAFFRGYFLSSSQNG